MDKARHHAILRVKENEYPDGGEEIRGQVARTDGWLFQRADVARDVDHGEPPAGDAYQPAEPEEFFRETLLLPKRLLHQIVPPAFTVTPPLFRPGGKTCFPPPIHHLDRLGNFAGRKAFFASASSARFSARNRNTSPSNRPTHLTETDL